MKKKFETAGLCPAFLLKRLIFFLLFLSANIGYGQLNIDYYMRVGETRIQIGNYIGAIEDFNIVIRFKPHLPEPYYYRGLAKHQLEDFRGAINDYDKAVDIKPYYPEAYMYRALAYLQANEFAKSIADYNKAIELNPRDANIYNNRGIAKISMKDINGAIADYSKALEINPKFTNSYINRSNALLMKNDIKGAIKDLNQAIIIRPHYANAYLLRGLARFELNDYASALRDFDQCIKLDPQNAYAYNNRGIVKQKLEDFKGAINDYNLALQLDPTMANAYMNRGIAKENLKIAGFEQDYATASKLDPKFAFNPKEVDYNSLAQAKKKANQQPAPKSQTQTSQAGQAQQPTHAQTNQNTTAQAANVPQKSDTIKNNLEPRKETKEERDRRRYKLSLADSRNFPITQSEPVDDGKIQNKNIIIELQPIFTLTSHDKNSDEYYPIQYYNSDLEALNNFNHYEPTFNISNKISDSQREYFQNSILYFNEKINKNNKENLNFLSRSIFYSLTDEPSKAMNDLQKALEINSKNALFYFARANCRIKMNEILEQVQQDMNVKSLSMRKSQNTKENTEPEEFKGDYTDVFNDYSICLQMNPQFPYVYFNQAYIKCKLHDYQGALADLNKAIDIEKDFAEAYYNRGLTRIYLDDIEGGAIDLSKAGELGIQDAYNVIKRYCN
jgi:tetratricopeptide (TPR) repeat protein